MGSNEDVPDKISTKPPAPKQVSPLENQSSQTTSSSPESTMGRFSEAELTGIEYDNPHSRKMVFGFPPSEHEPGMVIKLLSAGLGGCTADLFTFPLDTAKVRLQVQSVRPMVTLDGGSVLEAVKYRGVAGTLLTIAREEGARALYGGLTAGLQRQLCFASVRIGAYDSTRDTYARSLNVNEHSSKSVQFLVRICAGLSTGAVSVLLAQPTDVVKIRMQASANRYSGCIDAYSRIARTEGVRGLWKGTSANIARTAIVNVCEVVSYDLLKTFLVSRQLMADQMPCHFTAAFGAGFITTVVASPVDVVKTRFMNSSPGSYENVVACAAQMMQREGATAFYKGFWPSFLRLSSWSVFLFVSMEQFKRAFLLASHSLQ